MTAPAASRTPPVPCDEQPIPESEREARRPAAHDIVPDRAGSRQTTRVPKVTWEGERDRPPCARFPRAMRDFSAAVLLPLVAHLEVLLVQAAGRGGPSSELGSSLSGVARSLGGFMPVVVGLDDDERNSGRKSGNAAPLGSFRKEHDGAARSECDCQCDKQIREMSSGRRAQPRSWTATRCPPTTDCRAS